MKLAAKFALTHVALGLLLASPCFADVPAPPQVRTKVQRDALSPEDVLHSLKAGNERFLKGRMLPRNLIQEQQATSHGQHPSAIILSCIDSRAPAEFLFDKGIGEIFNARVAGNIVTPELTASIEFATALAGAKLVVVMGHTSCGAIKGAIDHAQLGHLEALFLKIEPAIASVNSFFSGKAESSNPTYERLVTKENIIYGIKELRLASPVLKKLEDAKTIKIVGALYDIETGRVNFLP